MGKVKILGIDTSTKTLSIGIYDGSGIYEYNVELGVKHSSLLMPIIQRILGVLGWGLGDIDYFACGLGPGSFTGIRVGVAVVKGLAWANRKPVIGIPTLDILADSAKEVRGNILVAVDAKRGLVYSATYKIYNGILKRSGSYALISKDEFLGKIKLAHAVLGDAAGIYKDDILKAGRGIDILDKDCWYPKGHCIIELALKDIKRKKFDNAFDVEPIYLYPKECQIR